MEAGREFDAVVAEKILGWTEVNQSPLGNWFGKANPKHGYLTALKRWSTSWAAMREVVEAVHARWPYGACVIEITGYSHDHWVVTIYVNGKSFSSGRRETLPHAVCLAALKAVKDDSGS